MHAAFQTVELLLVLIAHSIGSRLPEKECRDSIEQGALRGAHERVRAPDAAFNFFRQGQQGVGARSVPWSGQSSRSRC